MFQHFIISPFSYRRPGYSKKRMQNPLNPKVLEHRIKMFEIVTLPSISAQLSKDFTWIILVDPLLPPDYKERMKQMINGVEGALLQNFSPECLENNLNWLKPYIHANTQYVATSLLGCDDGLIKGFTAYVKQHCNGLIHKSAHPPLLFIGCKDAVQWDFFYARDAPLGYKKPWIRSKTLTVATGLTICCKYPELDYSIMGFKHRIIDYLFIDSTLNELDSQFYTRIIQKREEIARKAKLSPLKWDGKLTLVKNFHEVSSPFPQSVVLNHFGNVRFKRLFGGSDIREVVRTIDAFPEIELDYEKASVYIKLFQRSIRTLFLIISRVHKYDPSNYPNAKPDIKISRFFRRLSFYAVGFWKLR